MSHVPLPWEPNPWHIHGRKTGIIPTCVALRASEAAVQLQAPPWWPFGAAPHAFV